jgi:hypothetical protein
MNVLTQGDIATLAIVIIVIFVVGLLLVNVVGKK